MNATARITSSGCEIWAPTQAQSDLRKEVAAALGLSQTKVRVHTTKIGGGFGRRLKVDYAVYAAQTAQKIGVPVKLIWTREEDTQHGFYRPASAMRLRAALDKTGSVTALETRGATNNDTAFGGIARIPYEVPSLLTHQKRVETHLPYGSWRATDRTQNMFFLESFIDEVALATKTDPLALRHKLLANNPRNLRVLNLVTKMSDWGKPKPGRHLGMAFTSGYSGTRVAQVAEVSVDAKRNLRVHKIWCAFDCGTTVNPNAVKAQIEGGILMGLSAALAEEITIKDGKVEQGLYNTYPILRMSQAPEIEIQLLESENEPVGGVGEPPLPPVAPAIANAIFAATGERIRELPFAKAGFLVG
jgi:CO/xanthine dehydrogenase Mo-binding subunit